MNKTAHTLFTLAEQANARFTATLKARTGRTELTASDYSIPEVRDALREKLNASEAWLMYLRHNRRAS